MVMARGLSRAFKSSRSNQVDKAMEQEQRAKAMQQASVDDQRRAMKQAEDARGMAMQNQAKAMQQASVDDQRRAMKQAEDARGMAMQNQAKAMMGPNPQMPAAPSVARTPTMSPQGMNRGPVGPQRPGFKKGGSVSSASKRADGCAQRGKTKGRMI